MASKQIKGLNTVSIATKSFELTNKTHRVDVEGNYLPLLSWGKKKDCVTLYRIRATRDIPSQNAKAGDLGGWVESEYLADGTPRISGNAWLADGAMILGNGAAAENARMGGSARIYGNARIFGYAGVFQYAKVFGRAKVFGCAIISEYAEVSGNTRICGDAFVGGSSEVFENAWVYQNARLSGKTKVRGRAVISGNAQLGRGFLSEKERERLKIQFSEWGWVQTAGSPEVFDDAEVSGDSVILGRSKIYGNSKVSGRAIITEMSQVSGDARVKGATILWGTAHIKGRDKVTRGIHRGDMHPSLLGDDGLSPHLYGN